jgi:hypothetical protein
VVVHLLIQHVNLATLTESELGVISNIDDDGDDNSKKKKDDDHTSIVPRRAKSLTRPRSPPSLKVSGIKHWIMHM